MGIRSLAFQREKPTEPDEIDSQSLGKKKADSPPGSPLFAGCRMSSLLNKEDQLFSSSSPPWLRMN